ncbi:copper resistance CopC family protein [Bacillus sp. JJ1562]|uniref:copper resistance CopC family protein n=1 Tax=Bacillus sp. JJ1562 TaxID=3122960 RepID=UPI00300260CD
MIKRVITIFVLLFVFTSNQVFAHTALKESSPSDGQVVKEPLQEISLVYETKIEQTSKFEVMNSNGESVSFESFIIEEDLMKGSFSQSLENGSYKVVWKIVGADGHIIDGGFSFTVDAPVEETPAEDKTENQTDNIKEENIEKNVDNQKEDVKVEEPKTNQESEQTMPNYLIPTIVFILLIIGAGLFWWLVRRKK